MHLSTDITEIIIFTWLFILAYVAGVKTDMQKECSTIECNNTASTIRKYMDLEVDPCEDFYKFTCGNFPNNINATDDTSALTQFIKLKEIVTQQLEELVEEPIASEELKPFQLVKKLYRACMNQELIKNESLRRMQKLFKKFGGWPLLEGESWRERDFNWYHLDYFITTSVVIDLYNASRYIIKLDKPTPVLSREVLIKGTSDDTVLTYYNIMVDYAVFLGADEDKAAEELEMSLNFEIELAKILLPEENDQSFTNIYQPMTVEDLQNNFPIISWLEYINYFLPSDSQTTKNEILAVYSPKYLRNYEELVKKTPKRVQANYFIWKAFSEVLPFIIEAFPEYLPKTKSGIKSRSQECIGICTNNLPVASGALYVRNYANEESRRGVLKMVQNIQKEYEHMLSNTNWMDIETRMRALNKTKSMLLRIGYPDEFLNNSKLNEFYEPLELDQGNYVESILNCTFFHKRKEFSRLHQIVNKNDWFLHGFSTEINYTFRRDENSIEIYAGILQDPLFNINRPNYMNYGAIGFITASIITHEFDNLGSHYDENGNINEWWTTDTRNAFVEKMQCILNQYGNYTVPYMNKNLNDVTFQDDILGSNVGIKAAYLAYKKWSKQYGSEETLPGLNYTPDQMFWISAAHTHCTKFQKNALERYPKSEVYRNLRIINSFSNSAYFAKDFNCPVGSKMNPTIKCEIW